MTTGTLNALKNFYCDIKNSHRSKYKMYFMLTVQLNLMNSNNNKFSSQNVCKENTVW